MSQEQCFRLRGQGVCWRRRVVARSLELTGGMQMGGVQDYVEFMKQYVWDLNTFDSEKTQKAQ